MENPPSFAPLPQLLTLIENPDRHHDRLLQLFTRHSLSGMGLFWRYVPDRLLVNDISFHELAQNFANETNLQANDDLIDFSRWASQVFFYVNDQLVPRWCELQLIKPAVMDRGKITAPQFTVALLQDKLPDWHNQDLLSHLPNIPIIS